MKNSVAKINFRRDSKANWELVNPILGEGEPGYDLTQKLFKIGDGVTTWINLPYQTNGEVDITEAPETGKVYGRKKSNSSLGEWVELPEFGVKKDLTDLLALPYEQELDMGYKVLLLDETEREVYGKRIAYYVESISGVAHEKTILEGISKIVDFGGTFNIDDNHNYVVPTYSTNFSFNVNLCNNNHSVKVETISNNSRTHSLVDIWVLYTKVQ